MMVRLLVLFFFVTNWNMTMMRKNLLQTSAIRFAPVSVEKDMQKSSFDLVYKKQKHLGLIEYE